MIYGVVTAAWTWVIVTSLAAIEDWPLLDGAWSSALKVGLPVLAGLSIALEITRLGGQGREPSLVYTLSELTDSAAKASTFEEAREAGRGIFDQLEQVHRQALGRRVQVIRSSRQVVASGVVGASLRYQTYSVAAGQHHRKGCFDSKRCASLLPELGYPHLSFVSWSVSHYDLTEGISDALIKLGLATRAITERQRWYFWLWCKPSERTKCRDRRLLVRAKGPGSIRVCHGIVGADEVYTAMHTDPSDVEQAARRKLAERYGREAPWSTSIEIGLRAGLIEASEADFSRLPRQVTTLTENAHPGWLGRWP
jgi:hypothetical protein